MTLERQVTFWIGTLATVIAVLWLLSDVLLPFIAGFALAYVLNPLTSRLERMGMSRLLAALAIVSVLLLAIILLFLLVVPILVSQLAAFIDNIPGYVRAIYALLTDPSRPRLSRAVTEYFGGADKSVNDLVAQGAGWLATFLRSLWSGGRTLISIFSLVVVTPVVAFYLIYDWPRMVENVDGWLPRSNRDTIRALAAEIDAAIAGFVRGQTAVCLMLGAFYALALSLVGLNFGLLIGFMSGLISFIPYLGSMTGLVLSSGVALAQFWPDWRWIAVVLGVYLVGQFVEGNVLSPKLVGDSVGLHPLWIMFALFAFGYLFGFAGLLIAIPLAAAIGVLARFGLRQYLASPIYTGEG